MVLTVVAPIILLVYSYYNFDADRGALRVALELAPPGSFEHHARMAADPTQVTLFLISFHALRIRTLLSFVLRIGMNLSLVYRLKRIVELTAKQHLSSSQRTQRSRRLSSSPALEVQRSVPKWVAALFAVASGLLLAYTHACVARAQSQCAAFEACVAHAHRLVSSRGLCPCLVMIDVDKAPKTFAEWIDPPDVTETLRALAASGNLQVLEVANRRLVALPQELHACRNMRHMYVVMVLSGDSGSADAGVFCCG